MYLSVLHGPVRGLVFITIVALICVASVMIEILRHKEGEDMGTTIKYRTVHRNGSSWTIEVQEVVGKAYQRQALVKRGTELWATVQLKNTGDVTVTRMVYEPLPALVLADVKKDLGVLNE